MEYQRLGNSGLKVSKIILGCMSYGSSQWQDWVLDEEQTRCQTLPLFKAAYDAGINTWDTADVYSHGMSEVLVGKAIEKYAIPRKKLVIMTKCYSAVLDDGPMQPFLVPRSDDSDWVNQFGLSRKHIFNAVDASVARLGTYIDVLQIHRLDDDTTPEEIMEALHDAIKRYEIPRKKLVILTKCYCPVNEQEPVQKIVPPNPDDPKWINQFGLSRKHIFDSVDASVARLGTYIDVLQIHRLDDDTTPEEVMEALHDVVKSGKVRYIGASSMWAHEFATLQFTATLHGWTKFISMQNFYNLLYREEEREMIPFCNKTGVGLIPWSPIARGILARPWDRSDTTRAASDWSAKQLFGGAADEVITKRVEKVAAGKSVPMASVAIAWVLSKGQAPIVGLSSIKRIQEAVAAVKVKLTAEEVKFLEEEYSPKAALDISFSAPPPPSRA